MSDNIPIRFGTRKVAVKKFAELKQRERRIYIADMDTSPLKLIVMEREGLDGASLMLAVDEDNLRAFAYEILGRVGARN